MSPDARARRAFLVSAGSAIGTLWLTCSPRAIAAAAHHADEVAAGAQPATFSFLNATDAADVDAIAACIIPSGSTPGAREARVVVFIDRALATFFASQANGFRQGLAQLQQTFRERHAGIPDFAAASEPQQISFLKTVETSAFFGSMKFLSVLGFLSSPKYGGNAAMSGWKAIGFEDQHIFAPPFGYYDRDYPGFKPHPASERAK